MLRSLTLIAAILASSYTAAQLRLDQGHYDRLIVPEGTYADVIVGDIQIDTLIMEGNSSLRFMKPHHMVLVKRAHLRGKVSWKGAGKTGDDPGSNGEDGADLYLQVTFHELGLLTIDTRGGAGSNGKTPMVREGYITFEHPGNGGNGGDGGDINFTYTCVGFTPRFDKGKKHAIHFKTKGGSGAIGGFSNRGSNEYSAGSNPKYSAGPQGKMGDKGKEGVVVVLEM